MFTSVLGQSAFYPEQFSRHLGMPSATFSAKATSGKYGLCPGLCEELIALLLGHQQEPTYPEHHPHPNPNVTRL